MTTHVETYKGEKISCDEEGFFWRKDGYFESVARCRLSIDDEIAQDEEFYAPLNFREDTPSIAPAWHSER